MNFFSNLFQNKKVKDVLFITGVTGATAYSFYDSYKFLNKNPAAMGHLLFGKPSFGSVTQQHMTKVVELQKKMEDEEVKPSKSL